MITTSDVNTWAKDTERSAIGLLAILSVIGTISGIIFMYFDVRTSYRAWGNFVETKVNVGQGDVILAVAVSLLPTFVQAFWFVSKTTNLTFISNNPMVKIAAGSCFVIDSMLDLSELTRGADGLGWGMAVLIVFIIFGLASEWLLSTCGPIAWTLVAKLMENSDWSLGNPRQAASHASSQASPISRGMPGVPSNDALEARRREMMERMKGTRT